MGKQINETYNWLHAPKSERVEILQSWDKYLTEDKYGEKINSLNDRVWMSQVMHTTASELLKNKTVSNAILTEDFNKEEDNILDLLMEASDYSSGWDSTGFSGTGTDTIGAYGKLILPIFRRMAPQLIAPAFLGTQPMAGPNGFVVALKARYMGNGSQKIVIGKGIIFVLTATVDGAVEWSPDKTTAIGSFVATGVGHVTQLNSGATGIVRFREGTKVLVEESPASTFTSLVADTLSVGNGAAATQEVRVISAMFDNEAGYNRFFKNYSWGDNLPDYTNVAGGENTGSQAGAGVEIQEMGIDVTKAPVTANERKLKATWPEELNEDLRAQLSLDLRKEMIGILTQELLQEQNREMIDEVNGWATAVSAYNIDTDSDGRWHLEKIRGFKMKLDKEAQQIYIDTRRGAGNRLLVSPNVLVALKQLPDFQYAKTKGAMKYGNTFAGTCGDFDVYVDTFATSEYCTIGYKGTSSIDAGGFWAPYVGLTFGEAKHPETVFDTIIAFRTRYGILENPFGAELYFRTFTVNGLSGIGIV